MRLAEAANMDPMHGTPTPGRDFPEREPPHPWVSRLGLMFGWAIYPVAWLWRKIKEWTL